MHRFLSFPLVRHATACALLFMLSACNASDDRASAPAPDAPRVTLAAANPAPPDNAALVDEVSTALQACSYDGEPVRIGRTSASAPSACRDMVAKIMNYTGLPQNFTVVEAGVPNAAAVIMLDDQQIPQRVIAFNPEFIDVVRNATHSPWAPLSIMAHEIGHHLSGHTIVPGGSQPPIELEADKFSGFVLYKMGAELDDAQKALATLVPDGPDGKTHPGRRKRLLAVREGWEQACMQQHGTCAKTASRAANAAGVQPPKRDTNAAAPDVGDRAIAAAPATRKSEATPTATASAIASVAERAPTVAATADHVPAPGSIPSKFDRFIYDEYGLLDPTLRGAFEEKLVAHAARHGVEVVTLLVRELHGLQADAYALAMLRELRVGKLDVGNGAVIVVAPDAGQAAVAWGPGIANRMGPSNPTRALGEWLKTGWPICVRNQSCGNWTENLMYTADHVMRDTDSFEWTIRYPSMAELMRAHAESASRTNQQIARIDGTVMARDVQPGYTGAFVNSSRLAGGPAVHVQTADGYTIMLYLVKGTESLMPGGALEVGKRYQFVARAGSMTDNRKDTHEFEMLSYSALD